jgi:LysR family transcriptional regulator, transcriptional activator of the cysJI operon
MIWVVTPDSLKLFRDIAQSRSFSKGAVLNEVSQSAASQLVQELERSLQVNLLDRSTRPLSVTPAGQIYLEFCRDVLRRHQELLAAFGQLKQRVEGTVRVASIYSIGLSEMVQLEKEFGLRHPDAALEIQYLRPEKVYGAVEADSVDLGLVSYAEASREIQVIPWRHEEMVLATAPDHRLARKVATIQGALPPEDLQGVDFIGFDEDLPIRRAVDAFLREHGIQVNLLLHFDNLQMVKEAVVQRVGVSLLPARVLRDDIRLKRLAAIRIAGAELYRPLGIIHRKKKRFQQAAQAFLELLQEKPAGELGAG